jgi:hypothetical protein
MWDWINCNLFGRHEQVIACVEGSIHLRCLRCGHRSDGWQVDEPALALNTEPPKRRTAIHLLPRRQE